MTRQSVNQIPDSIKTYSKEIAALIAEAQISKAQTGVVRCFRNNEEPYRDGTRLTDNYITCSVDVERLVDLLVERMKPVVPRKKVAERIKKPCGSNEAWIVSKYVNVTVVRKVVDDMRADKSLYVDEGSDTTPPKWNVTQTTVERLHGSRPRSERKRDTHVLTAVRRSRTLAFG